MSACVKPDVAGSSDRETKRQIKRETWRQREREGVVLVFSTLELGGEGGGGRNRLCRKTTSRGSVF